MMKSIAGQEIIAMLPSYYANNNAEAVIDILGTEVDNLCLLLEYIIAQLFATSTGDWALDYWEQDLGLVSYTDKPDEQRRSRIISKLRGEGMVTINLIKNVAESYVYGTVDVLEQPALYSVTARFVDNLGVPPNLQDLIEAIENIVPAHLAVTYEYKYLLIKDIHEVMTISEMETHSLTDFAPFEPVL